MIKASKSREVKLFGLKSQYQPGIFCNRLQLERKNDPMDQVLNKSSNIPLKV